MFSISKAVKNKQGNFRIKIKDFFLRKNNLHSKEWYIYRTSYTGGMYGVSFIRLF
jgi:hypothetical protein